MTIPSTGQKVKYRPYLVKEEKVLLQAFESQDVEACIQAMVDTIKSCIDTDLNVDKLPTFDLEYMFVKLRGKSVGETSSVMAKCKECGEGNPVDIDLEEVKVEIKDNNNFIDIGGDMKVEMKYPTYDTVRGMNLETLDDRSNIESAFEMIAGSLAAVHTNDERIDCSQESKEEVLDFIQSLTTAQLSDIMMFLNNIPTLTHNVEFQCRSCQHENKFELRGISDFF